MVISKAHYLQAKLERNTLAKKMLNLYEKSKCSDNSHSSANSKNHVSRVSEMHISDTKHTPLDLFNVCSNHATSIFLYACESWTFTAELKTKKIQALEMRCYCKILHISNKDHVTNEKVHAKIQQAI